MITALNGGGNGVSAKRRKRVAFSAGYTHGACRRGWRCDECEEINHELRPKKPDCSNHVPPLLVQRMKDNALQSRGLTHFEGVYTTCLVLLCPLLSYLSYKT